MINCKVELREIRLAANSRDEWRDNILNQGGYDASEGAAYYYRDG